MNKLYVMLFVQILMVCNAMSSGWTIHYLGGNTIEFCKSVDSSSETSFADSVGPVIHQFLYPIVPR